MSLLKLEEVTKKFGGLTAVKNFSTELAPRELCALIGPNGSGKTTIFNMITGIYVPTQGKISFNGKEITAKRPDIITGYGIARTFQNIRLFKELSVLNNVRIAAYSQTNYNPLEALLHAGRFNSAEQKDIDTAMDLLAVFQMDNFADEASKNLPYGLQRRLEIARAMATKPKLLLLDEPAAGINPNEIVQLMEFIQWIRRQFDLTIILIEHQMRLVMNICERIKVLDFGATIAEGFPIEIQHNPKVMEAYLGEGGEL